MTDRAVIYLSLVKQANAKRAREAAAKSCETCKRTPKSHSTCWACLAAQELGEYLPYHVSEAGR